jgi:hypothetical protein
MGEERRRSVLDQGVAFGPAEGQFPQTNRVKKETLSEFCGKLFTPEEWGRPTPVFLVLSSKPCKKI